jgi:internalin A
LQNHKNLVELRVAKNQITHLATLSSPALAILDLSHNRITDLSPLRDLKSLRTLHLSHNHITDLSPLLNLPSLQILEIWNNPLSQPSLSKYIPTLQKRGVTVYHQ